ncbi:MAG: hypothetical protein CMJ85_00760 [Planctomycetes bacterium]|nr:hypothetical protein [Planctomycetota bacterium]MDP6425076.1 hypothetical protein [Planctomycetota bacterium]
MLAWAWSLFGVYLFVTALLAWHGGRKTTSTQSFAIGSGRMNPWMAGLTLGACTASSSLFVIMPGWVYADGLPALLGFGVSLIVGLSLGFWVFAPRFQEIGADVGALTVPHWIGERYRSPLLRRVFAGLGLLQISYLVLVVVGCGYVMRDSLGISYQMSVVLIVVFVFGYTGFGGAWAHALTNSLQGAIMLVLAIVIFASGIEWWLDGSLWKDLASTGLVAPESQLFSTHAEVWIVQTIMVIGFCTQPQLLSKALYVDGRKHVGIMLLTAIAAVAVYTLVLFAGAYARLGLDEVVPQDQAASRYYATAFLSAPVGAAVTVTILAASMSTLDGLIVALSASLSGDLIGKRATVSTNRIVLTLIAIATAVLALHPPELVQISAQIGIFALIAASGGPLVAGLYLRGRLSALAAFCSATTALTIHFGMHFTGLNGGNPGIGSSIGLVAGIVVAVTLGRARAPA